MVSVPLQKVPSAFEQKLLPEARHLRKLKVPQINKLRGLLQCFLKLGLSDPSLSVLSGDPHQALILSEGHE